MEENADMNFVMSYRLGYYAFLANTSHVKLFVGGSGGTFRIAGDRFWDGRSYSRMGVDWYGSLCRNFTKGHSCYVQLVLNKNVKMFSRRVVSVFRIDENELCLQLLNFYFHHIEGFCSHRARPKGCHLATLSSGWVGRWQPASLELRRK